MQGKFNWSISLLLEYFKIEIFKEKHLLEIHYPFGNAKNQPTNQQTNKEQKTKHNKKNPKEGH